MVAASLPHISFTLYCRGGKDSALFPNLLLLGLKSISRCFCSSFQLIQYSHSVVTTVRSTSKAEGIRKAHPSYGKDKLDFVIVADVAQADAFDDAVVSDPPFEAVIHTASPFHFNVTDIKKDLLDPAINGTTGILRAIKENAPTVKRVVRAALLKKSTSLILMK